jgi:hypothetical protein
MKSLLVSLSLVCMTTTVAVADIVTSSVINSVQAGILCAPDPIGSVPAPNTLAGTTHIIEAEPEFVATITTVPASLGVGFGVKAQARAVDGISEVTMVVTHPPMGPDAVTLQSFQTRINGDNPSLTFYQFDYVYELVIGTWVFTAMSGDESLFSASFEVVDPRRVPELAGLCGYLDLLS